MRHPVMTSLQVGTNDGWQGFPRCFYRLKSRWHFRFALQSDRIGSKPPLVRPEVWPEVWPGSGLNFLPVEWRPLLLNRNFVVSKYGRSDWQNRTDGHGTFAPAKTVAGALGDHRFDRVPYPFGRVFIGVVSPAAIADR